LHENVEFVQNLLDKMRVIVDHLFGCLDIAERLSVCLVNLSDVGHYFVERKGVLLTTGKEELDYFSQSSFSVSDSIFLNEIYKIDQGDQIGLLGFRESLSDIDIFSHNFFTESSHSWRSRAQ
jgi:hypothetical protein